MDVYSTNETKTNKVWTDGKPIYRKVLKQTLSNSSEQSYNLNITNLNALVYFDGCITNSTYGIRKLNATYYSSLNYAYQTFINTSNKVVIQAGSSAQGILNGSTLYLFLYYTKTTD